MIRNVKAAQKYLNAMFGGHKDWVKLDEDGKTGTAVMQGIIRARVQQCIGYVRKRMSHLAETLHVLRHAR